VARLYLNETSEALSPRLNSAQGLQPSLLNRRPSLSTRKRTQQGAPGSFVAARDEGSRVNRRHLNRAGSVPATLTPLFGASSLVKVMPISASPLATASATSDP
jgi:hypothetical protein